MMSRSLLRTTLAVATGMALVAAACSDTPADPAVEAMERLAGVYVANQDYGAIVLTTTDDGGTTDWLAAGASLTITLRADGTTTGRMFVPGGDEDGADLDADLTGTWTVSGDTVRFSQEADTFVRDMPFLARDGRLEGDRTFVDVRVRAVLARR